MVEGICWPTPVRNDAIIITEVNDCLPDGFRFLVLQQTIGAVFHEIVDELDLHTCLSPVILRKDIIFWCGGWPSTVHYLHFIIHDHYIGQLLAITVSSSSALLSASNDHIKFVRRLIMLSAALHGKPGNHPYGQFDLFILDRFKVVRACWIWI